MVKKFDRSRVGSSWLDSFNFRRETVATGWGANALLVFIDDLLVYQLISGQPTINEYEVQHNPLGPLQGWSTLCRRRLGSRRRDMAEGEARNRQRRDRWHRPPAPYRGPW
jgi:hypothetical protein